jgi:hypothetical protein
MQKPKPRRRLAGVGAFCLAVLYTSLSAQAMPVTTFADLNTWGEGDQIAGVIIDWNDGKSSSSLAWGYRWSGTQTAADMMTTLAASDPRLFLRMDTATSFGPLLLGIGYQTGDDAFGVTGAQDTLGNGVTLTFSDGLSDANVSADSFDGPASSTGALPVNAADRYVEGFNDNGFWSIYFAGTNNFATAPSFEAPTEWIDAFVGLGGATLEDEGWYGFSFAAGFVGSPPDAAISAIPEPATGWLLLSGGVLLWWRQRRGLSA